MLLAITIPGIVAFMFMLVAGAVIVGLLHFMIAKAPESLIPGPYKVWINYALLVMVVFVVIGMILHFTGIYDFREMR